MQASENLQDESKWEYNGLSGHPQDQRGEITHWKRDIGINKINEEGKIQGICRGSDGQGR